MLLSLSGRYNIPKHFIYATETVCHVDYSAQPDANIVSLNRQRLHAIEILTQNIHYAKSDSIGIKHPVFCRSLWNFQ